MEDLLIEIRDTLKEILEELRKETIVSTVSSAPPPIERTGEPLILKDPRLTPTGQYKWSKEQEEFLVQKYRENSDLVLISKQIKERFDIPRTPSALKSRINQIQKEGLML